MSEHTDESALIREAADLMRSRAAAATPGEDHLDGRYSAYVLGSEGYAVMGHQRQGRRARTFVARCGMNDWDTDKANAEHLAGWSPSVAGAVADLLDHAANMLDLPAYRKHPTSPDFPPLVVARAYLGAANPSGDPR